MAGYGTVCVSVKKLKPIVITNVITNVILSVKKLKPIVITNVILSSTPFVLLISEETKSQIQLVNMVICKFFIVFERGNFCY